MSVAPESIPENSNRCFSAKFAKFVYSVQTNVVSVQAIKVVREHCHGHHNENERSRKDARLG